MIPVLDAQKRVLAVCKWLDQVFTDCGIQAEPAGGVLVKFREVRGVEVITRVINVQNPEWWPTLEARSGLPPGRIRMIYSRKQILADVPHDHPVELVDVVLSEL